MPASRPRLLRQSHKKSLDGCRTCKRRHIRCDGGRPQCQNCISRKVECVRDKPTKSGDTGAAATTTKAATAAEDCQSQVPSVSRERYWPAHITELIDEWRSTESPPVLPGVHLQALPISLYTDQELCHIYHIAAFYSHLSSTKSQDLAVWVRFVPELLSVGSKFRFVMSVVILLSISHLTFITGIEEEYDIACELACKQLVLGDLWYNWCHLDRSNADAVLVGTIALSWLPIERECSDSNVDNIYWMGGVWRASFDSYGSYLTQLLQTCGTCGFTSPIYQLVLEVQASIASGNSLVFMHLYSGSPENELAILMALTQDLQALATVQFSDTISKFTRFVGILIRDLASLSPLTSVAERNEQVQWLRSYTLWLTASNLLAGNGRGCWLILNVCIYTAAIYANCVMGDACSAEVIGFFLRPLQETVKTVMDIEVGKVSQEELLVFGRASQIFVHYI